MPDTDGITLLREWSVTDGYDCPVVMMSGHGTVETAVEATRLGAFDFVEKPLSLTKLLRTVERALDAGRRKRLSERTPGFESRRANRQEQAHAGPARAGAAGRLQHLAGAVDRRTRLRTRSLCALLAFALRALRQAVLHGGGGEPWWSIRRRRCSAASATARSVPGAFDQAAGGSLYLNGLEDLTSDAQRALLGAIEQNAYTRVGGRERLTINVRWVSSAQEGFESGRLAGAVSPQPDRASERHHPAGAAAARVCGGRARTCCATTWTAWSTISICRCAASASRRRTGCAIIPGPATSANSRIWCSAC